MLFRSLTIATGVSILAVVYTITSVSMGWQAKTSEQEAAVTFTVDSSHSTLTFRVPHMNVAYFHGRINKPAGNFTIDDADLAKSAVNVIVQISNMDSGSDSRNLFLTGPQLFDAAQFPTLEFHSTSIRKISDATYEATGDFTMHGVTKSITIPLAEYTTLQTERMGHRAGFECIFTVKQSEYGMNYAIEKGGLGDGVRITGAIEGVVKEG